MRLFDVEGYAEAAARFREILAVSPRSARALAGLAEAHAYWGHRREIAGQECRVDYDRAYALAAEAVELAPGRADGHRALSLSLRGGVRRDRERAEREALLAVALDPDDAEAWHQAWRAAGYDLGDPALRRALELGPSCALENDLGAALCAAGRLDEAVSRFLGALRLNPRNTLVYHNLAMTLDRSGMRETAVEVLRRARALHPGDLLLLRGWNLIAGLEAS